MVGNTEQAEQPREREVELADWLILLANRMHKPTGFWREFFKRFLPSFRERQEFFVFWASLVGACLLASVSDWLGIAALGFAVWWASVTAARHAALETDLVGRAISFMRHYPILCYGEQMTLASAVHTMRRHLQTGMKRCEWAQRVQEIRPPRKPTERSMDQADGMRVDAAARQEREPGDVLADLMTFEILAVERNEDGAPDSDTITLTPDGREAVIRMSEHPHLCG